VNAHKTQNSPKINGDARWEIKGVLARSCRPGYDSHNVSRAIVAKWLTGLKEAGVRSFICLLDEEGLIT